MCGIEERNQKHLYGVFGDAQWTNKNRLPDALFSVYVLQGPPLSLSAGALIYVAHYKSCFARSLNYSYLTFSFPEKKQWRK